MKRFKFIQLVFWGYGVASVVFFWSDDVKIWAAIVPLFFAVAIYLIQRREDIIEERNKVLENNIKITQARVDNGEIRLETFAQNPSLPLLDLSKIPPCPPSDMEKFVAISEVEIKGLEELASPYLTSADFSKMPPCTPSDTDTLLDRMVKENKAMELAIRVIIESNPRK